MGKENYGYIMEIIMKEISVIIWCMGKGFINIKMELLMKEIS